MKPWEAMVKNYMKLELLNLYRGSQSGSQSGSQKNRKNCSQEPGGWSHAYLEGAGTSMVFFFKNGSHEQEARSRTFFWGSWSRWKGYRLPTLIIDNLIKHLGLPIINFQAFIKFSIQNVSNQRMFIWFIWYLSNLFIIFLFFKFLIKGLTMIDGLQ